MKTSYLSLVCAAVASGILPAAAQLPDPAFATWVNCIPWTSTGNEKAEGTQPEGWTISNVIGIAGLGATTVGAEAEGIDGAKAVTLTNSPNPYMAAQIVPGYLTLGTTWSTAVGLEVLGGNLSNNDGGSFGGIGLDKRPDGVHFSFKRTVADGSEQNATVVAYLWKGTFEQADVPGNIVLAGSPAAVKMVNRDRNILGMETNKGGEVTKTEGAALIAKVIRPIVTVTEDWESITVPLEYVSDETPEMFNVIFAANDYFDSQKIDKGNSLTIASPELVYWSKLSDIRVGDETIAGFDDATYTYYFDTLPAVDEVTYTVLGQAARASVEEMDGTIVITVTNPDGTDEDGVSQHTYVLTDREAEPTGDPVEYKGILTVDLGGSDITGGGVDATVTITPTGESTCIFVLPDLTLPELGSLGDIALKGVKYETIDGLTTYSGAQEGMKLMDGALTADVTLAGTVTQEGKASMVIDVIWFNNGVEVPIKCTFNGQSTAGITGVGADNGNAPVELYNLSGVRISGIGAAPGIYIRRQGSDVTKIIIR